MVFSDIKRRVGTAGDSNFVLRSQNLRADIQNHQCFPLIQAETGKGISDQKCFIIDTVAQPLKARHRAEEPS